MEGSLGFASAFLIGLVAALSTCMAVSGGLIVATTAKFAEKAGKAGARSRLAPALFFVAGRVVSYALLGGLIGLIGTSISLSPAVSGALTIVAAAVMLALGLDMLKILPRKARKLMPAMPAPIARRIINAEGSVHPAAPFLLGAGTFFLPCGFTQALQIYALSSGGFVPAALVLGGFALGTAPSLLALGWFAGSGNGRTGRFFFRLAAAGVVILGLAGFKNGFNLIGWPRAEAAASSETSSERRADFTPEGSRGAIISMTIGPDGYSPASFTIRAGEPVTWKIDARRAPGCAMAIVSSKLGIRKTLAAADNRISFTAPSEPGTYSFSCPMGMYRGSFIVIP